MTHRLALPVLAGVLAAACLAPMPAVSAGSPALTQLYAMPQHGHSGDVIYLSGSGFPPRQQLVLTMACPGLFASGDAYKHHNYEIFAGPIPDAHGQFVNFKIKAIQLHDVQFSNCLIYTTFGDNAFAVPASYEILSPIQPLKRCDKVICANVTTSPRQVRTGSLERVQITNSWPAAQAVVTVKYGSPRARLQRETRVLDWEGRTEFRFRVGTPAGVRPIKAHVQMAFSLEDKKGAETADFVVIH